MYIIFQNLRHKNFFAIVCAGKRNLNSVSRTFLFYSGINLFDRTSIWWSIKLSFGLSSSCCFRNAAGGYCNGTDALDAKSSQLPNTRNCFWTYISPDFSFNTSPLCEKYGCTTYRSRCRNDWYLKKFG